jgi:hypothetical protein
VSAGTVTLATSDANGAYRQATVYASMIPSQPESGLPVISPISTMASAERFNMLARLRDESGRPVSTTYRRTRRKHSRPLPTAIAFAPGSNADCVLVRSRSSTSRVDIGVAKEEPAATRLNPSVAPIAAQMRG